MSFKIVVTEVSELDEKEVKRFEMTVDVLDLKKVIAAVTSKPRGPRTKKEPKS